METSERTKPEGKFKYRFVKIFLVLILAVIICAPYWVFAGCASYPSDMGASAPENEDASKTNVQEDGVDEADIVKVNAKGEIFKAQRDGVTISLMNKTDGKIEVVRKKAAKDLTPLEMFLYGDKYLIVINAKTTVEQFYYDENNFVRFNYDTMVVNVYDLNESPGEIRLLRSDEFRGTYKTSRLTDGNMYLLSNYSSSYGEAYVDYFNGAAEFDVAYRESGYYGYGGYLIAKLNLEEPREKYQTALYADRNVYDIYCSKYAFYVMKSTWFNNYRYRRGYSWGCGYYGSTAYDVSVDALYYYGQITESIDRISLDTLERTGTAQGFNGYSPDRFCLYDNGEYLFVANQKMYKKSEDDEKGLGSWLYVFDKEMNETAALGPLASGETMYSARYDGSIAYIVTAKRALMTVDPITFEPIPIPQQVFVDPLFKIDISEPLAPVLLGELEIEGFSTYMQTFGDGLLLGLGRGADGTELKISLFDASGDEPAEVNSLLMKNGAAEAESEARAILCEQDKNIFAFAARFDEGGMTEYGTLIFGLEDGELSRTAFLREIYPDTDYSRKRTRRVARIGDYLLTVSDGYIASYLLSEVIENGGAEPSDIADTRIDKSVIWHTVKVVSDQGLSYPDRIVERGYFVTLPKPEDIEDLWQFGYWTESRNSSFAYQHAQPVSRDMTLYAKWYKLPWRTVDFNLNLPQGASGGYLYAPQKQTVEDGGKLTSYNMLIGTLIPNYKLTHWYIYDPNTPFDFNAPVAGSYTLYAYWKSVVTHTVTFDYNYPDQKSSYNYSMLVEDGTKAVKPNGITSYNVSTGYGTTRYVLEYWYAEKNVSYNFNSQVKGNITLRAKWTKADN